jgi:hypothetical protein
VRGEEYISESRKKGGSLMFQFLCFVMPWLLGVELKGNHPATPADALNRHIEQVAQEEKLMGLKTRQPRGSNTRSIETVSWREPLKLTEHIMGDVRTQVIISSSNWRSKNGRRWRGREGFWWDASGNFRCEAEMYAND